MTTRVMAKKCNFSVKGEFSVLDSSLPLFSKHNSKHFFLYFLDLYNFCKFFAAFISYFAPYFVVSNL